MCSRQRRKTTFLALGDQVTDKDYSIVVVELVNVKEFEVAIDILEAGVTRFPESPNTLIPFVHELVRYAGRRHVPSVATMTWAWPT